MSNYFRVIVQESHRARLNIGDIVRNTTGMEYIAVYSTHWFNHKYSFVNWHLKSTDVKLITLTDLERLIYNIND